MAEKVRSPSQMNTSNADSFFRTDAAREKSAVQERERDNKLGAPLKLGSKLLSCTLVSASGVEGDGDGSDARVLVAEAVGRARCVDVGKRKLETVYAQHMGPCTTALLVPRALTGDAHDRVYTASWDKTIKVFDANNGDQLATLDGHTDFVKSLALAKLPSGQFVLVSGSSDSHARVWSLRHQYLYTLRGHSRGVECLVWVDHLGVLLSGGSESSIRAWRLGESGGTELGEPFWGHDTSIYSMVYSAEHESLYTASADKTARQCTIALDPDGGVKFVEESRLEHPDYVLTILPLDAFIATGCRDGQVRLFDPATGELRHTLKGHFDAVTGLASLRDGRLVSASLDGTLRTWSLTSDGLKQYAIDRAAFEAATEPVKEPAKAVIDEDELAELEALMEDD